MTYRSVCVAQLTTQGCRSDHKRYVTHGKDHVTVGKDRKCSGRNKRVCTKTPDLRGCFCYAFSKNIKYISNKNARQFPAGRILWRNQRLIARTRVDLVSHLDILFTLAPITPVLPPRPLRGLVVALRVKEVLKLLSGFAAVTVRLSAILHPGLLI